jgi:hypothetical protein
LAAIQYASPNISALNFPSPAKAGIAVAVSVSTARTTLLKDIAVTPLVLNRTISSVDLRRSMQGNCKDWMKEK